MQLKAKYRLAFSSSRRSFRESTSWISCIVEVRQEKDFAALDILEALEEYFLETLLAWLKPSSLGRTFVRSRQLSWVVVFRSISRWPKGRFTASSYWFKNKSIGPGYICLARVKICNLSRGFLNSTNSDCLGLCCGYLSPDEIDSGRYNSSLHFDDENNE